MSQIFTFSLNLPSEWSLMSLIAFLTCPNIPGTEPSERRRCLGRWGFLRGEGDDLLDGEENRQNEKAVAFTYS
jgi:hypothetical protein